MKNWESIAKDQHVNVFHLYQLWLSIDRELAKIGSHSPEYVNQKLDAMKRFYNEVIDNQKEMDT